MSRYLHVGFGDFKISSDPESVLTALGLGSCVAVTLYDPQKHLGGMVHVVLPDGNGKQQLLKGKYADVGIPNLLNEMEKHGGERRRIVAKIAGGAKILKKNLPAMDLDIGGKNVKKCVKVLQKLKIPLAGQDTGGTVGRVAEFHVDTGVLVIRQRGEREL